MEFKSIDEPSLPLLRKRCFFHQWSKWQNIRVVQKTYIVSTGKEFDTSYNAQIRDCFRCLKRQKRKV